MLARSCVERYRSFLSIPASRSTPAALERLPMRYQSISALHPRLLPHSLVATYIRRIAWGSQLRGGKLLRNKNVATDLHSVHHEKKTRWDVRTTGHRHRHHCGPTTGTRSTSFILVVTARNLLVAGVRVRWHRRLGENGRGTQ